MATIHDALWRSLAHAGRAIAGAAMLVCMFPAAIGATAAAGGAVGALTAVAIFTLAGRVIMGGR